MSIPLLGNAAWFEPVCQLCILCVALLYLETAFTICVGCHLYRLAVRIGLLRNHGGEANNLG